MMKEGTRMNNREIRGQAWKLFKRHYVRFVPAMAVSGVLLLAASLWNDWIVQTGIFKTSLAALFLALVAPVQQGGVAVFARAAILGDTPGIGLMFQPLRSFRRVGNLWLAALAAICPVTLATLAFYAAGLLITASVPESAQATVNLVAMLALYLPALIAAWWINLRLTLYPYAAAREPEQGVGRWLKASWSAMRGKCWRLFRLTISVDWPILPLLFAAVVITREMGVPSADMGRVGVLTFAAFTCVFMGYPALATARFAEEALDDFEGVRKPKAGKRTNAVAR
jgi:hypothetical protein